MPKIGLTSGTVAITLALSALALYLASAHSLRLAALGQTGDDAQCDELTMKASDCYLYVIIPKNKPAITSWLVQRPTASLMIALYSLAGAAGAGASMLLMIFFPGLVEPEEGGPLARNFPGLFQRLLIGVIFGFISFLTVMAAGNGLVLFPGFSVESLDAGYQIFTILPVLAGLFFTTFYKGLRSALKKIF